MGADEAVGLLHFLAELVAWQNVSGASAKAADEKMS